MDDVEFKLRIERKMAIFEEQARWTAKYMKELSESMKELSKDQKNLNLSHSTFKARVTAQTGMVGAVVALLVSGVYEFLRSKFSA